MGKEERLQKAMKRVDSAILHVEALQDEVNDDDVYLIVGHLKRAKEMIQSLYYAQHHEGKKLKQLELF